MKFPVRLPQKPTFHSVQLDNAKPFIEFASVEADGTQAMAIPRGFSNFFPIL